LQEQHEDAKSLKESIDKRKQQVGSFLEQNLDRGEYEQYINYVNTELRLIVELGDLDDQISHCEDQISAVTAASS